MKFIFNLFTFSIISHSFNALFRHLVVSTYNDNRYNDYSPYIIWIHPMSGLLCLLNLNWVFYCDSHTTQYKSNSHGSKWYTKVLACTLENDVFLLYLPSRNNNSSIKYLYLYFTTLWCVCMYSYIQRDGPYYRLLLQGQLY